MNILNPVKRVLIKDVCSSQLGQCSVRIFATRKIQTAHDFFFNVLLAVSAHGRYAVCKNGLRLC
jgi:hypothetical protein